MPNSITDMLTGIFPSIRRSEKLTELERKADMVVADLKTRTDARKDRNDKTRASMSVQQVHDACESA